MLGWCWMMMGLVACSGSTMASSGGYEGARRDWVFVEAMVTVQQAREAPELVADKGSRCTKRRGEAREVAHLLLH
ncbi:leucine-rich repeat extensin-like protein 3 [Iris pallida]|uniref:Leucine-rich repeat extensin-like protein 3 n=1 Tax=Iris pallida TaxID=29817 RepID=A0AAX6I8Q7_IRIPA|nr:leucine-rich repeat extensin-like protein 3 [Iris pallida]